MTASSRPRLVVHEPRGRRVVSIDRPVIRIGRAANADLQLGGADISREHALLLSDAEGYLLRDQSRASTSEDNPALERFPQTLDAALDALESDAALCAMLGENFVGVFTAVKRHELARFHSHVTDWEVNEYLELY